MRIRACALALCVIAACQTGGGLPGYLKTDVLEPDGMGDPVAQGVKMQGTIFQEGTLTYNGKGEVQKVFTRYIEVMRGMGWAPTSTEQDPAKGMTAKMVKDTRTLSFEVTGGVGEGAVKAVIRVTSGSPR